VRAERERVRFRLHLVKHRTQLKNRVHSILIGHGLPGPVSDLFGVRGRELLARQSLPEPWASTLATSLALIDTLDEQISGCERELRSLGADHAYVPLLLTLPGVGWIHAFTLSSEIGDIARFPTPTRLIGYSGLNRTSSSRASRTGAARSPSMDRATCVGRSSRPRTPLLATRTTNRPHQLITTTVR
jgi:transposase